MAVVFKKSVKMGSGYVAHMKIQSVPVSDSRPDGFKVNFVLIHLESQKPVLLVDNHKPFGYHLHPTPDQDHRDRVELSVSSPFEALDIF
jgi:hypothetical protein